MFKLRNLLYVLLCSSFIFLFNACDKKETTKISTTTTEEVKITAIEIDSSSIKTNITYEEFNLGDIQLIIKKSDGTSYKIPLDDEMVNSTELAELSNTGSHIVNINYLGFSTSFTINIKAAETALQLKLKAIFNLGKATGTITETYEEWLETIKGEDGVGINNLEINDAGDLLISLTNGTNMNLGKVTGNDGLSAYEIYKKNHPDYNGTEADWLDLMKNDIGIVVIGVEFNEADELIVSFSDNSTSNLGKIAIYGLSAFEIYKKYNPEYTGSEEEWLENVVLGVSITKVEVNETGEIVVYLSNDTEFNLGRLNGSDGLSAYEIYLRHHPEFTGTEEEWLEEIVIGNRIEEIVTVTFDSTGGDIDNQTITTIRGTMISFPTPTKVGYHFLGWYTGDTPNDILYTADIPVNQDLTLYARWERNEYTVTFLDDEGFFIRSTVVKYGYKIWDYSNPTKKGYTFVGWDKSLDFIDRDMIVHAIFKPNTYIINFDTGVPSELDSIEVEYNSTIELPIPTKSDYTFVGWVYNEQIIDEPFHFNVDNDINLVAKWMDTWSYLIYDNEIYLVRYYGNDKEIVIPAYIDNLPVVSIGGELVKNPDNVEKVIIPNTVTAIEEYAFSLLENLKEVVLANDSQLELIGTSAFFGCKSLEKFDFGDKLKVLDPYAFSESGLKNVTIPKSTTYIHQFAFSYLNTLENIYVDPENAKFTSHNGILYNKDMTSLIKYPEGKMDETYTIPESVTNLLESHSINNNFLKTLYIPKSVSQWNIKLECESLTDIIVAPDNPYYSSVDGVLYNKDQSVLIRYPENRENYSFIVPSTVSIIDNEAFGNANNLQSVTIANTVTVISPYTFYNAKLLAEVIFEQNSILSKIDIGVFRETAIKSITIPSSVESIGVNSFSESLETITFLRGLNPTPTNLNETCFSNNIKIYVPSDSVDTYKTLPNFYKYKDNIYPIEKVYIVKFVDYDDSVISTQNVKIGDSAKEPTNPVRIGYTFTGWNKEFNNITNDLIIKATYVLNKYKIYYQTKSGTYLIPKTIKYGDIIESLPEITRFGYIFKGWYLNDVLVESPFVFQWHEDINLEAKWIEVDYKYYLTNDEIIIYSYIGISNDIVIPETIDGYPVVEIQESTFYNLPTIKTVVIPKTVRIISDNFVLCSGLERIEVDSNNEYYTSVDGVLYNKDKTIIIRYPEGKTDLNFTIPNTVITIGSLSFRNIQHLEEVIIPNTVTLIDYSAFYDAHSLKKVMIPNSVTVMQENAFNNAHNLVEVTFEENSQLKKISNHTFFNTSIITITIPKSIVHIDTWAFSDCFKLEHVYFEENSELTFIGQGAFERDHKLLDINIPKSVKTIDSNAFLGNDSLYEVIFEADSQIEFIGERVFSSCSNLKKVVINKSISAGMITLGENAFYGTDIILAIYFPEDSYLTYKNTINWNYYRNHIYSINLM